MSRQKKFDVEVQW